MKYFIKKISTFFLATAISVSAQVASSETKQLAISDTSTELKEKQAPQIETVLVTARRQENKSQDLVFSNTAINNSDLKQLSATHAHEILARVPSAWVSRNNGQEQLTAIRSPVFTGAGSCAEFLMMEDGIALRPIGLCNVNQLFEAHTEQAKSIEVIPSSGDAFFGTGSVHGIINVVSAEIKDINEISLEAGSYDFYRTRLKSGQEDKYLVAATFDHDGGFMEHAKVDQQKLTVKWKNSLNDWDVTSALSANNLNQNTAEYVEGHNAYKNNAIRRSNPELNAYRDAHSMRFYSRFRTENNNNSFELTPYLRFSEMDFSMHFLPGDPVEENSQQSIGLLSHYKTSFSDVSFTTGIDLEIAEISTKQYQPLAGFSANFPQGDQYKYDVLAWKFSPFTQLLWTINTKTQVSTGIRFETVFYDYNNLLSNGSACDPAVVINNCRYYRPKDSRDRFAELSPNIGVKHQFNDQWQWFSNLSHGYRAPETSELYRLQQGQQSTDLGSVLSNSLETGLRFTRSSLKVNTALFYTQKENVIFQDSLRQWVNDAETSHLGLETSLDWQINSALNIKGYYTIARHRYENNPQLLGVSTPLKGNDIDTAPRTMGNLLFQWQMNDNNRLELESEYLGRYYTDPENNHSYSGHQLWHISINSRITSRLSVNLRVQNLLNKSYAERADYSGFAGDRYFVGHDQSLYLRMDYSF